MWEWVLGGGGDSTDPPVPPGGTKYSYSAHMAQLRVRLREADLDLLELKVPNIYVRNQELVGVFDQEVKIAPLTFKAKNKHVSGMYFKLLFRGLKDTLKFLPATSNGEQFVTSYELSFEALKDNLKIQTRHSSYFLFRFLWGKSTTSIILTFRNKIKTFLYKNPLYAVKKFFEEIKGVNVI